jgi:hypothetical protein
MPFLRVGVVVYPFVGNSRLRRPLNRILFLGIVVVVVEGNIHLALMQTQELVNELFCCIYKYYSYDIW